MIVSVGTAQLRLREAAGNIAIAHNVQIVHIAGIVHAGRGGVGKFAIAHNCANREGEGQHCTHVQH